MSRLKDSTNQYILYSISAFSIIYAVSYVFVMDFVLLSILGIDFLIRSTNWKQKGLFEFISQKLVSHVGVEPKFVDKSTSQFFARVGLLLVFVAMCSSYAGYFIMSKLTMIFVVLLCGLEIYTLKNRRVNSGIL